MTCINVIRFRGPANEGPCACRAAWASSCIDLIRFCTLQLRVSRVQGGLGFILGNDGILLRYIPGIMGSDA